MGKRSREKRERRFDDGQSETFIKKRSDLERVYFRVIEWGTYLALFTPLILVKSYFFPYVVPKTIFFRIIVDIIFIAYVLLVLSNRKYLPKFNALAIAVTIFIGITILTSFTGINLEKSFWSAFERMTGLLTFFHLFAFFIILTSCFRERKYWERILTISILAGVIISFYTLFDKSTSGWGGGTIGNPSFMASYLLFDIFFAVILFFVKKGGWKIFYGITFIIMLLPMFINVELPRGGIMAFFAGIFILGLGYMVFSGKKLLVRLAPAVFLVVVLAGIGIIQTDFFKMNMFDIRELPGQDRQVVWRMSWNGFLAKPWLGWGIENYNVTFLKHFDPAIPLGVDIWYDRAHNIVLDSLVSTGIIGTISFFAVFAIAIFSLLRVCRKIAEKRNVLFPLGMATVLAVYFIQDVWVFDMISSYMMFFLSLAFINFLISPKEEMQMVSLKKSYFAPFIGALLIILTIFTIYFGNIQPARASRYTLLGIALPLQKGISYFQKAMKVSPMSIFETPEQFSRRVTSLTRDESQNKKTLLEGFELSAQAMENSIAKNPEDFRPYLILGRQFNDFFNLTQDPEKLKKAEKLLEKAIRLSPGNQQGYWALAQTRLYQGRESETIDLLNQAIDLEPRFLDSHWYLAMSYGLIGNYELAAKKLEDILEIKEKEKTDISLPWEKDLNRIKRVIEIYQHLEDDEKLVPIYLRGIELEPGDAELRAGLAVSYANLGQFDKARQYAKEAMALNPDFTTELEEFLKSLPK